MIRRQGNLDPQVRRGVWMTLAGLALLTAAFALAWSGPPADANIGAGILGMVGLVLAGAGGVGLLIALIDAAAGRRGHRPGGRNGRT